MVELSRAGHPWVRPSTVWLVTEVGSQGEADGVLTVACLVISDTWLRLCVRVGTKITTDRSGYKGCD